MDTREGQFKTLGTPQEVQKFRKAFSEHMDEAESGHERKKAGPPIFTEGEIIEIRGGLFKVTRISRRKLFLRAVKG